ncbi:hypothetical protein [Mycolicibacterium parafortuitum]|uniref:Uncharacterized protein n=1 Tax=Mycolicibacterium parafortuitum TaxID=39692 RepID=A0A375YG94_MYCPF|nr:hypothetical protein [Mycolicibacterium parafortuitum]ORB28031.1 hypothetical protein BST38_22030 [Mycolicibacterium parafortuitum]SRX80131.1 hypothetical protein MPP7335_01870 [Mycolicibacterium parafortuitum]
MARSQPSDGSVFCAILLLLLAVGFVIKYIWWFVGGAVLVALFAAIYWITKKMEEDRELEADEAYHREFERTRQAERQKLWTLLGDKRAIYGEDGAAAMNTVADAPDLDVDDDADDDPTIARLATTPTALAALVRDKPRGWEQAVFVSALVQRAAPLQSRLRDSELGFPMLLSSGGVTLSPRAFRYMAVSMVDEMLTTVRQLDAFMAAPAFMGSFSGRSDEDADPEAIKHIANRLMDFLEQFLELSERARALHVRSDCAEIAADLARVLHGPVASIQQFIADFVDVVNALPRVLKHATGPVDLGSLALYLSVDDKRFKGIIKRLDAIKQS